ncbi:sorting nexin 2B-like [Andrographis paniculata]|uniref:sorting nexin 2B-like n=1 Tax=Andrographis paniculata TaxID=175694 RepID=UPI0021E71E0C|nr:sorting nexin 2B-like [Andrographis paniculata]
MMGYEQGLEEAHLYASKEQMASLVLSDHHPSPPSNGSKSLEDPLYSSPPFAEIHANDNHPLHSPPPKQTVDPTHTSLNSFLEPPSYAEAVFQSFDLDSGNVRSLDHSPSASQSFSSDYLRISVSDPRKEQDVAGSLVPGGGYYFSYLITTFTNFPEFSGTEFNVRRRFKDVVALSERLAESYRGFFIPMRPDKSVVESQVMQQIEFVEQRRSALEKYLRRLAAHPVIRRSSELRVFLEDSGTTDVAPRMVDQQVGSSPSLGSVDGGAAAAGMSDGTQAAKTGRDFFRIFRELKQSVTNDWGGTKPPLVEEDREFVARKEKLQEFEQQLSNVSQQAELLVKSQQDIGETMGQLGLAFVKLTKFETEVAIYDSQRARAADMKNVATAAVKASRLFRELNAQTVKHLDKLHEYLGVMLAANNAFSERSSALLTVQTLLSDLASLNSRIEKLEAASSKIFGGDGWRIKKIEELQESVRATEDAKNSALREYERIKDNNRKELERIDKEKHDDFVSMLKGFVVNQAGYAEKMASVWKAVVEETSEWICE